MTLEDLYDPRKIVNNVPKVLEKTGAYKGAINYAYLQPKREDQIDAWRAPVQWF